MAPSDGSVPDPDISPLPPQPRTRRLSDKVGVVFFGMAAGFVVHFVWGIALVRLLDKQGVGTYRQIWLVYGLASVIFQLGVPASIAYFVPQLPPRRGMGFVLQVFVFMVALGGIMGAALFFGASLFAHRLGNPALAPLFQVFAPYPLFFLPVSTIPGLLIVRNRHRAAALLQFTYSAQAPAIAAALLALKFSLQIVFAAIMLSTAVLFFAVLVWVVRLCLRTGIEWRRDLIGRQIRYSTPIGLASTVSTLGHRLDQIVISLFFEPGRYAIYTVGAFEVPVFSLLNSAISSVLTPELVRWYANGETERLLRVWHRTVVKMSMLILPTIVAAFAAAPLVVTILYTQAYEESAVLFRIFLFVLLVRVTQYSMVLRVIGRTGMIFWASVGYLACNLVLAIVFVKTIGFVGPAVATVLAHLVYAGLLLHQICAGLGVSTRRVMPWRDLLRVGLVALVSVLPSLLILTTHLPQIVKLVGFCLTYGACYLVAGSLFRVLTREDLALIRNWATLRPLLR